MRMLDKSRFKSLAVLCLAVSASASTQLRAEPQNEAAAPLAPQKAPAQWRAMRVKNVRPGIMAWWLDPTRQAVPWEFAQAQQVDRELSPELKIAGPHSFEGVTPIPKEVGDEHGGGAGSGPLEIPQGVLAIAAIDVHNAIHALADEASWDKLRKLIELLDQPIRIVEIEMQVVEIAEEDMKAMGWQNEKNVFDAPVRMTRAEFDKAFDVLKNSKQSRITNSPRVTVMNNMTATLYSTQMTPAKVTIDTGASPDTMIKPGQTPAVVSYPAKRFMLAKKMGVVVSPTINNDDSITLLLRAGEPLFLVRQSLEELMKLSEAAWRERSAGRRNEPPELFLEIGNGISTITNVMPGEVICIGASRTITDSPNAKGNKQKVVRHLAYFVMARAQRPNNR